MFIIVSGGPTEEVFKKYFNTYMEAEQLLLDNGFKLIGQCDYRKEDWDNDFKINGIEIGFQAYIEELEPYII